MLRGRLAGAMLQLRAQHTHIDLKMAGDITFVASVHHCYLDGLIKSRLTVMKPTTFQMMIQNKTGLTFSTIFFGCVQIRSCTLPQYQEISILFSMSELVQES
jgi:hypothetical protein